MDKSILVLPMGIRVSSKYAKSEIKKCTDSVFMASLDINPKTWHPVCFSLGCRYLGECEFESVTTCTFFLDQLAWLIECGHNVKPLHIVYNFCEYFGKAEGCQQNYMKCGIIQSNRCPWKIWFKGRSIIKDEDLPLFRGVNP
jgi:hypothetical protein